MKTKWYLLFALLLVALYSYSQNYQIGFTASGTGTNVDSVKVKNLAQNTQLTLAGGDILHLLGTVGTLLPVEKHIGFSVYPNPFSEKTLVDFVNIKEGNVRFELMDIAGKKIMELTRYMKAGTHMLELSVRAPGIYYFIADAPAGRTSVKLISMSEKSGKPQIVYMGQLLGDFSKPETKIDKATVPMQYNDGETLLFTAFSGNNSTVSTLIPTQSQSLNFVFSSCSDIEGNNYATVVIGTQTWMAENLKTATLKNGTTIPVHTNNSTWGALTTPACAWYMNDPLYKNLYGTLYNWYTVNTGNLCPTGWHVPTDTEWNTLANFAGGQMVAGGKLKETGFAHWSSPNAGATNEFGFTALPGGCRNVNGASIGIGITSYWFTATESDTDEAYFCGCMHDFEMFGMAPDFKSCGYYVRCLKD